MQFATKLVIYRQAEALVMYAKRRSAGRTVPAYYLQQRTIDSDFEALSAFGIDLYTMKWSDTLFLVNLGCILGSFKFRTRGSKEALEIVPLEQADEIEAVEFNEYDTETVVSNAEGSRAWEDRLRVAIGWRMLPPLSKDELKNVVSRVWHHLANDARPSDTLTSDYINQYKTYNVIYGDPSDLDNVWKQANIMRYMRRKRFLEIYSRVGDIARLPGPPECDYILQPIARDRMCLYRALAQSLLYRLTGFAWAHPEHGGIGFPGQERQPWEQEMRAYEDYETRRAYPGLDSARVIDAALLNVLAKWVRFYVWVVLCTAYEGVYYDNIEGFKPYESVGGYRVAPMTRLCELVAVPPSVTLQRVQGRWPPAPKTFFVPSLDLVVRYLLWIRLHTFPPREGEGEGKRRPQWSDIRRWLEPLMVPPVGVGPFSAARGLPEQKRVFVYSLFDLLRLTTPYTAFKIQTLISDTSEYKRVYNPTDEPSKNQAFAAFADAFVQHSRIAGEPEMRAFSSLFSNISLSRKWRLISRSRKYAFIPRAVVVFEGAREDVPTPKGVEGNVIPIGLPATQLPDLIKNLYAHALQGNYAAFEHGCPPLKNLWVEHIEEVRQHFSLFQTREMRRLGHFDVLFDLPVRVLDPHAEAPDFVWDDGEGPEGRAAVWPGRRAAYDIHRQEWEPSEEESGSIDADLKQRAMRLLATMSRGYRQDERDRLRADFYTKACHTLGATLAVSSGAWDAMVSKYYS